MTHIKTESAEPAGEASPIGKRVSVKRFDAKYESGIRTQMIDSEL